MAFKLIFCLAALSIACIQARPGGPAAYSISAPSVDHASVGNTQEHTVKGHYGQSSQSDYASQVQTAHSQSHVQRSSISNDAGLAPAAHYAAAPAAATYTLGHTAPAQLHQHQGLGLGLGLGLAYAGHGYAAAAPAPALAYGGHYGITAPAAISGHQLGLGLGLGYGSYGGYGYSASAPAYSHGYLAAAPAPAVVKYAAAAPPAYAPGIIGHGIGLAAAPAYATHLAPAPLVKAVAAPALVHASVSGHGIQYGY